jgi:hypothetical protein
MAVRVSLISRCICAATARRAAPSSRLRRCKAAHLAHQTFHAGDPEVNVNRERGSQMFDHLIAFFRLGLDQKLVDDGGGIGLFAQASGALLQGLGPMRFLAGGSVQGLGASRAVG